MCVKPKRRKAYRLGRCWYEMKKIFSFGKENHTDTHTHLLTPELSKDHTGDRFKLNKPRIWIFQKSQHFLFIAQNYLNFHSFWQLYSLFSLFVLFSFSHASSCSSRADVVTCCIVYAPSGFKRLAFPEKSSNFTVLFFHSFSGRLMPNPKQVVSIHFIDVTKQKKITSHSKRVEGAKRVCCEETWRESKSTIVE